MPRCTLPQDLGLLSVSRILFYFIMLRTLLRFFALSKITTLFFSSDYALFDQKHWGVPIYLCQCIRSKGKRNCKLATRSAQSHPNTMPKISQRLIHLPPPRHAPGAAGSPPPARMQQSAPAAGSAPPAAP